MTRGNDKEHPVRTNGRELSEGRRALLERLETLYERDARPENVGPDPLRFVRAAADADREVVGLLASALAYGRVQHIGRSVEEVLERLGDTPRRALTTLSARQLEARMRGFRHRFTAATDLGILLGGMQRALEQDGSLEAAFTRGLSPADRTVLPALGSFVSALTGGRRGSVFGLLPDPARGSACKRLHLFLRWMVRRDRVDPGPWRAVRPDQLIVPLDTHLFRIARALRLTRRRQADGPTALAVTEGFRRLRPEDPVRYDFVLARLGMRDMTRDVGVSPRRRPRAPRRP